MFRKFGVLSSDDRKISWWWLGIKVGLIAGLIVWWWLENQDKKNTKNTASEQLWIITHRSRSRWMMMHPWNR